jgi:hypothetical protein
MGFYLHVSIRTSPRPDGARCEQVVWDAPEPRVTLRVGCKLLPVTSLQYVLWGVGSVCVLVVAHANHQPKNHAMNGTRRREPYIHSGVPP